MSWIYVPGSAGSRSPSSTSSGDSVPCATSKSTHTVNASSNNESKTDTLTTRPSTPTSVPSTDYRGLDSWIASLRASRANHSPSPGSSKAKPTNETSGPTYGESFAKYDRATFSWRTCQLCLDGTQAQFLETWPRAGIVSDGIAYLQAPLALITVETGCGLLPTPTSRDWKDTGDLSNVPVNCLLPRVLGGRVNPDFRDWMMGLPISWTAQKPLAQQSFQQWLEKHGIS